MGNVKMVNFSHPGDAVFMWEMRAISNQDIVCSKREGDTSFFSINELKFVSK